MMTVSSSLVRAAAWMKSSFPIFRCLTCAIMLAIFGWVSIPSAPAQTSGNPVYYQSGPLGTIAPPAGYVGFEVPVERAGHVFTAFTNAGPAVTTRIIGLITTSGVGGAAEVRSVLVAALLRTSPAPTSWWLKDQTARQQTLSQAGAPTGTVSLLASTWTPPTGVANRYFAVPSSRDGHGLIYGNPAGAWTAIVKVNPIGTYDAGITGSPVLLPWFTAMATETANSATAFLADRTTDEKTVPGLGDVRDAAAWSADPAAATYPLVWVQVEVEAREAGHCFTVQGVSPGGARETVRVIAAPGSPNALLSFVLGAGTTFHLTRDAEDGTADQPQAPLTGVWTADGGAPFDGLGCFPAEPARPSTLVARAFQVNAHTRPDHEFSVRMSDGYTRTFGPVASGDIIPYGPALLENWLDNGVSNHLPIHTFFAWLDPTPFSRPAEPYE